MFNRLLAVTRVVTSIHIVFGLRQVPRSPAVEFKEVLVTPADHRDNTVSRQGNVDALPNGCRQVWLLWLYIDGTRVAKLAECRSRFTKKAGALLEGPRVPNIFSGVVGRHPSGGVRET